jgi:hypothetical protein
MVLPLTDYPVIQTKMQNGSVETRTSWRRILQIGRSIPSMTTTGSSGRSRSATGDPGAGADHRRVVRHLSRGLAA